MSSVIGGSSNQVGVATQTLPTKSVTARKAARSLRRYWGARSASGFAPATPPAGTRPAIIAFQHRDRRMIADLPMSLCFVVQQALRTSMDCFP